MKKRNNSIILIIGTRPEGIKLAPVYFALKELGLSVKICATFQHTNLLQDVFTLFGIKPDFSFNVMKENQDLFHVTQDVLKKSKQLFLSESPGLVIVQGDTTSAMSAALSAFYLKIPVAHIEAGLRTNDIYAPFPEELNRQFISLIAKYNFSPTLSATKNLIKSGVADKNIYEVGNTVVDALYIVLSKIDRGELNISSDVKEIVKKAKQNKKKLVLLTMHRREMFGDKMVSCLRAIKQFANDNLDVDFVYPVHPNPNVQNAINKVGLAEIKNVFLINSLPYHELIYILDKVDCVATDSGGIQEEAASLGKQVVLLRNETDRPESVWQGLAVIAGSDSNKIKQGLEKFLQKKSNRTFIYGYGDAAQKIANILAYI